MIHYTTRFKIHICVVIKIYFFQLFSCIQVIDVDRYSLQSQKNYISLVSLHFVLHMSFEINIWGQRTLKARYAIIENIQAE